MKELIERNYQSIVDRGLIIPNTTIRDFILKLNEEVDEFKDYYRKTTKIDPYEVADIILVCLNLSRHYNVDIEKILNEKIDLNFERSKKEKDGKIN